MNNTTTTTYTFTPTAGQCATTTTLTITVNPNITPTFTPVTAICSGDILAALPTTSNNGITGSWSPALNNTTTTTYTFTPTASQCASPAQMTITVNQTVIPNFASVGPLCQTSIAPTLNTTSPNGITGSWAPATINTATAGVTNYIFTPDAGQCASQQTLSITITPQIVPTFTQIGPLCQNSIAPALLATSNNGYVGSWSPASISTTSIGTSTYTFTPTDPCASVTTMDITIVAQIAPTFTQLGPFCQNSVAPTLPSISNNGYSGTWNPATISTASAGTTSYTFTPTDPCATTIIMDIVVAAQVAPTFTQIGPLCQNSVAPALPSTSDNGFAGTWSPASISTTSTGTTTYIFTPTDPCATVSSMEIVVTAPLVPTFSQIPSICSGSSLAALPTTSNEGITGSWTPALNNAITTIYTFTPTAGQCATTTTLTITVNPNITPTFNAVAPICSGTTLSPLPTISNEGITGSWSPALDNTTTTIYNFTPDGGQCATTTTLTIIVNQPTTGDTTATVCQNQLPFSWYGQSLTNAGDYNTTLTSMAGCDSILTLHFFVTSTVTGDTTATVCQNQLPFSWYGQSLTTAGDYNTTLTSVAGCDSVLTLHFFVTSTVTGDTTATVCQNQLPFIWYGQSLTTSGDYNTTLTSVAGCDSILTLHFFVTSTVTGDTTATVCQNQLPFIWYGQSLTTAGDYNTTLTSVAGCDSLLTLHFFVTSTVTGDTTATVCQNQLPFSWYGQSLTTAGDYNTTLTSVAGCDSLLTLHFFVTSTVTGDTTATVCQNQLPFSWYGQSLTTAGDYNTTLTSVAGCDSLLTLHFFVTSTVTGDTTATVCQNQLPFGWYGQSLTTAGDYNTTLTSVAGCDSLLTLHFFVTSTVTGDTTATVCQNQLPFGWYGQSLTTAGDYNTTLTSVAGCDSLLTLHFFVTSTVTGDTTATVCQNQLSFSWYGQSLTTAGDYNTTLTSVAGCDSILTLHFFVTSTVTGDTTATVCQNQLPFSWYGQSLTTAGDYNTTLTSVAGCDSLLTLHFFVTSTVTGDTTATVCQNQLPFSWYGQSLTTAGDHNTTLTSAAGCDSLLTLHFFVTSTVTGDTTATVCQNQLPFSWYGQSLTTAGDYNTTLTSVAGCDSLLTLHFFVTSTVTGDTTATVCQNQLPFSWYGQSLTTSGDYNTTLTSGAQVVIPNNIECYSCFSYHCHC